MDEMTLVSERTFHLILSVVTGGVAGAWVVHDILFWRRLRGKDRRDPLVADQVFGYVMGIFIGVVGVLGTLYYMRQPGVL